MKLTLKLLGTLLDLLPVRVHGNQELAGSVLIDRQCSLTQKVTYELERRWDDKIDSRTCALSASYIVPSLVNGVAADLAFNRYF